MNEDIKIISHSLVSETVDKIQEIVKIDSVRNESEADERNPFGVGIGQSLDLYLQMAKEIGMRTYRDPKGYYGYAEIGDESLPELIGILGHLDVVPIGDLDQWTKAAPFSGAIVDEEIIGRGTQDDKGPLIVNLMAIKTLITLNYKFTKRIRIILGTAEETTWQGIRKYIENEELPTFGYTPDGSFPVINAEKTILQYKVDGKYDNVDFQISAQGAYNAVADKVKYTGKNTPKLKAKLEEKGFNYTQKSENEVIVYGKSAHGSTPELGQNAILNLISCLSPKEKESPILKFIDEKIKKTCNGELLFGPVDDEVSGKLTLNIGWLEFGPNNVSFGIDMRIPVLSDEDKIMKSISKSIKLYNLEGNINKISEKLYNPADSVYIAKMINAYRVISKDYDAQPIATGGGTYARSMDNIVAFGMCFTNLGETEKFHQPNEALSIKYIPLALEIYANVLYDFTKDNNE